MEDDDDVAMTERAKTGAGLSDCCRARLVRSERKKGVCGFVARGSRESVKLWKDLETFRQRLLLIILQETNFVFLHFINFC
ncbi:hypothetical protein BRADI_1g67757v3 [Brachypodium distachyon]|uniref:Uncharacterized protein n=1 Tax=Brachypodium distachyon TaxID=15368 RepID=A0A2K2DTW8_BRADI|nr:hypothetical protein BRADI_1g67757v3 [Brachypodium distachyon]